MRPEANRLRLPFALASLLWLAACNPGGEPIAPESPPASDVAFQIDSSQDRRWIWPWIYGTNQPDWDEHGRGVTLMRFGGSRQSTYNWENNASNGGSDFSQQNDGSLGGGDAPGEAVRARVADAFASRAAALVTVPTLGYVAADKLADGDVGNTPNYLETRFRRSHATKGAPLPPVPDPTDGDVYQDEFVSWLEGTFARELRGGRRTLMYGLDHEPDLWPSMHPYLHPRRMNYDEVIDRTVEYARAVKTVAPSAMVFGPVLAGWYGFTSLGNAVGSATYGDFIAYYLDRLRAAEAADGRRLVDVLDVHWYPEVTAAGVAITSSSTQPAVVAARVQAPRSLWDPAYVESSRITRDFLHGAPIALLPRLQGQIDAGYPGTLVAITEYNYGAGHHVSGGLAQADVLGIFGRHGVYAAAHWDLQADERFAYGALAMYRNYDGNDGAFGNVSIRATTTDVDRTSVYGSVDLWDPNRIVVVALNKTPGPLSAGIAVTHDRGFARAEVYRLTAASTDPVREADLALPQGNAFQVALPPMSVTTLVLRP